MSKIMMAAAFGAGYVLGAKAGRERYDQLRAKAQELWSNPKVQEQAGKVQERAGQVQEQAKGRLSKGKSGADADGTDPWAASPDRGLAGEDPEDVRG